METYNVNTYEPVVKKYNVKRIFYMGGKYNGDCNGLAHWYYMNMNPHTDNINIYIYGDFHQTIPNPYHLTVEYEDNGIRTDKFHMSSDGYGNFYKQELYAGKKKKKKSGSKKKKKSGKKKSDKKKKKSGSKKK